MTDTAITNDVTEAMEEAGVTWDDGDAAVEVIAMVLWMDRPARMRDDIEWEAAVREARGRVADHAG